MVYELFYELFFKNQSENLFVCIDLSFLQFVCNKKSVCMHGGTLKQSQLWRNVPGHAMWIFSLNLELMLVYLNLSFVCCQLEFSRMQ